VTAAAFLDQVCQFFGGAYDANTHTYHTPTIAGLGVVRRAWAREDFAGDFFNSLMVGTPTGCMMVAQIAEIHDGPRVALPAIQGRRFVRYMFDLHCFFMSKAGFVEDCQDAVYALRDAATARIRTDPTLGSGGIENNAFQVGEGDAVIRTRIEQGGNIDGLTQAYMQISFEAHAYEVG
jgi:hypothetical protein